MATTWLRPFQYSATAIVIGALLAVPSLPAQQQPTGSAGTQSTKTKRSSVQKQGQSSAPKSDSSPTKSPIVRGDQQQENTGGYSDAFRNAGFKACRAIGRVPTYGENDGMGGENIASPAYDLRLSEAERAIDEAELAAGTAADKQALTSIKLELYKVEGYRSEIVVAKGQAILPLVEAQAMGLSANSKRLAEQEAFLEMRNKIITVEDKRFSERGSLEALANAIRDGKPLSSMGTSQAVAVNDKSASPPGNYFYRPPTPAEVREAEAERAKQK